MNPRRVPELHGRCSVLIPGLCASTAIMLCLNVVTVFGQEQISHAEKMIRQRGQATPDVPAMTSFINILTHPQISRTQLPYYAALLELSDAQAKALDTQFQEYVDADTSFRLEHTARLWEQSADLAKYNGASLEFSAGFERLMKKRDAANAELVVYERRFFESMIPFLTQDQTAALDRVFTFRACARARAVHLLFPASDIDLTERLLKLQFDGRDIGSETGRIREILIEYERVVTPLLGDAAKKRVERMIEGTDNDAQSSHMLAMRNSGDEYREELIELYTRNLALGEAVHGATRLIHDANRKYLSILVSALPQDTAAELETWFLEESYPMVFPDPFDLEPQLESIHSSELLDTDQAAAFMLECDSYRSQRDAVSDAMVEAYLDWWKHWIIQKGYARVSEYPDYQARMQTLQFQRKDNALRMLTTLSSILTEQQHRAFGQRLAQARDQVELASESFGPQWPPHTK